MWKTVHIQAIIEMQSKVGTSGFLSFSERSSAVCEAVPFSDLGAVALEHSVGYNTHEIRRTLGWGRGASEDTEIRLVRLANQGEIDRGEKWTWRKPLDFCHLRNYRSWIE